MGEEEERAMMMMMICTYMVWGKCSVALSGLLCTNMLPGLITTMGKEHIIMFLKDKNNYLYV